MLLQNRKTISIRSVQVCFLSEKRSQVGIKKDLSIFKDDEYIPVIEETDEVFDLSAGIYDDINLVFEKKSSNFVERYKSVLYTGAYKMVPITVIIIIALTIGLIIRERIRRNGG